MAEGYTQSFVLTKYFYDETQSTFIEISSETLPIDRQDEIKSFDYYQGEFIFYDAGNQPINTYIIENPCEYNNVWKALEVVQWDGSDLQDMERYNVPDWGGEIIFNAYFGGDPETGGNNTDPENPVPETTITLYPLNLTLSIGETGTLTVTTNSQQSITWNSTNTSVATVSSSGVVTAIATGTATITASVETKTASCTVTVPAPSGYTLNIYNGSDTEDIIRSTTIPESVRINEYIYNESIYAELNDRDGYYISEWKNHDTGDIIPDAQTMVSDLNIYPVYTQITTQYYNSVYLPNLIQRFPLGSSQYNIGSTGGEETVTLTQAQCALPDHSHAVLVDTNISTGYTKPNKLPDGRLSSLGGHPLVQSGDYETDFSKDTSNKYNTPVMYETGKAATAPHTNMPPYLRVNFIIKYK